MINLMPNLSAATFCVPIVDKYSPLAYAINDIHWNNKVAQHSGMETVWTYVLKNAYIIEGHSIIKNIKRLCQRCRYIKKKTICVIMGPFTGYSKHNKRTTLKIWLVVFCCAITTTVNIKLWKTIAPLHSFKHSKGFLAKVGYPKKFLPDEGNQLIKGCTSMKLDICDIKSRLNQNIKIDFETCPIGGHNMHGKVKHKIQEVKKSIKKTMLNK